MTEAELQASVVDLAQRLGYLVFHDYDSRRSAPGFPDLVLAHPRSGGLIFAELKDATRQVTPEQDQWLRAVAVRGVAFLWRPEAWHSGSILASLRRYARVGAGADR
jgi:hypothetical protein